MINTGICGECGKSINSDAPSCPYCGVFKPRKYRMRRYGFEWKSWEVFGNIPFIHVAFGKDSNGKLLVAKGIIAIGQFAVGIITIAQFGVGVLFGFGQFIAGIAAIGQIAGGVVFGLGQISSGYVAVGQVVFGYYGWAQTGFAYHLWSMYYKDPEAVRFFSDLTTLLRF